MKRKLLSALLLGAFTIASTSTFVSCKDNDEEIAALRNKDVALEDLINQKEKTINAAIADLQQADKDLQTALNQAKDDLTAGYKAADAVVLAAAQAEVASAKKVLEDALAALETKHDTELAALDAKLSALIAKAQGAAEAAQGTADAALATANQNTKSIEKVASDLAKAQKSLSDDITEANKKIGLLQTALEGQEAALKAEISNREKGDKENLDKINKVIDDIAKLKKDLEDADKKLQDNIDALATKVANDLGETNKNLSDLKSAYEAYTQANDSFVSETKSTISTIEGDISGIQGALKTIDGRLDVIELSLSKDLRSLVFMPWVYVDGIEAIPYPYFPRQGQNAAEKAVALSTTAGSAYTFNRGQRAGETIDPENTDGAKITIAKGVDYKKDALVAQMADPYLPVVGVKYHMNPATADPSWEDIMGFVQRDTRYTTTTRAASQELVVKAQKNDESGYQHFFKKDGILGVGIKVPSKEALNTLKDECENYIAALQVKAGEEANITSDYAEVYPEEITELSIAWAKENQRLIDYNPDVKPTDWDLAGADLEDNPTTCATKHHLYDNPVDALKASASVFVEYNSKEGVSLGSYLMTCFRRIGAYGGRDEHASWPFKVEEKFGFTYQFDIVEYNHAKNLNDNSGNNTGAVVMEDHKYAHLKGDTIIANAYGKTSEAAGKTAIGREPLVRVLLKWKGVVIRDAYILVRIVAQHEDDLAIVEQYKEWTGVVYNNCQGLTFETPHVGSTSGERKQDWADTIIVKHLNSEFDFLTFNGLYKLDGATYNVDANNHPNTIVDPTIYVAGEDIDANGTAPARLEYSKRNGTKDQIGKITLTAVTNNQNKKFSYNFKIELTAAEVEALTHDDKDKKDKYDFNVTRDFYIRWTAQSVRAPFKHIYQKLTVNIKRYIDQTGIKEKLNNYWYGLNGADEGWDAVVNNIPYPQNSTYPTVWNNKMLINFKGNDATWTTTSLNTKNKKYFFVPQNTIITVTDPTNGKTTDWVITPASGDTDKEWNRLACEKDVLNDHVWPLTTTDNYRAGNLDTSKDDVSITDTAALHKLMTWCNIAYNAGAFNNVNLYAVTKANYHNQISPYTAAYVKIAEMNPANGEITLVRDWTGNAVKYSEAKALDRVLNAIGYADGHKNISKELHTWVAQVCENGCNVANYSFAPADNKATNENFGLWIASLPRPINLVNDKAIDEYEAIKDAQSNGYYIPIYDLLKFYDWRGPVAGDMEDDANKWLWAYYNINRIEADLDPASVTTTLNGGKLGETTLKSLSGLVRLYPATAAQHSALQPAAAYTFKTLIGSELGNVYNSSNVSADLVNYLEGTQNGKANFGYIFYENNGQNLTEFIVRIPLIIYYEWGSIRTYTDVKINTTGDF